MSLNDLSTDWGKVNIVKEEGIFVDGDWVESKDQDPSGDIRLIQLADIGAGEFLDKSRKFMTLTKAEELKCTFLKENDLLIARMPDPIGRACIFPKINAQCVTVVDVCILRVSNHRVNTQYLKYLINSDIVSSRINRFITGTTRKRISRSNLGNIEIKVPPLKDQQQIVKVLDIVCNLRQKRKEQLTLLDDYLKSVFLEMFGDPVRNNKAWSSHELQVLSTKIGSGATPRGGKSSYKNEGMALIRSMNIHDIMFEYKGLAYIDDMQAENLRNVIVQENDVLFNITGASVCRCAIVPKEILPARVNQHVAIIRPNEKVNSLYLSFLLTSGSFKNFLLRLANAGGATREAITKEDLEKLSIPVPPINLQNKFSDIVERAE